MPSTAHVDDPVSVIGSQTGASTVSDHSTGQVARAFSGHTPGGNVARAYSNYTITDGTTTTNSTGDLTPDRSNVMVQRNQNTDVTGGSYPIVSSGNKWTDNITMKMPAIVNPNVNYFNGSTSDESSLPSTGLSSYRPAGGVFLNRTPSDAGVVPLSLKESQKRNAPGVPSGAAVRRSQSDAAAMYSSNILPRQALKEQAPTLPPTPEDTIRAPRQDSTTGLGTATNVDTLQTEEPIVEDENLTPGPISAGNIQKFNIPNILMWSSKHICFNSYRICLS